MTTSIHAKSIIAIFAVAAIAPVATAGAYPNEPVIADHNSSALSSTPADTPSSTSSLTALSHDSSATPSSATPSSASSLTALSHDSSGTVALRRDGSQAVPVVASLSPQP